MTEPRMTAEFTLTLKIPAITITHVSIWIWIAVSLLGFTSGTVVNCLNGLISLLCKEYKNIGEVTGKFRSVGQLGRSFGPVFGSLMYWLLGSAIAYTFGSLFLLFVLFITISRI